MTCRISLIVCTLGRRLELERALDSFTQQVQKTFEVIIVDQNPEGYLDEIVDRFSQRLNLRHVRSKLGLSRARNVGLSFARGEIVGFPDDDCWYGPEVCKDVLGYFDLMPGLALLTGRTTDITGRESGSSDNRATSGPISRHEVFRTGNSNTFFVRRAAISAIGGFDEDLGVGASTGLQSGEETDLLIRCIDRGFETHYDPAFVVFHDQVGLDRTEKTLSRVRGYSMGFGYLLRKHRYGLIYASYRVARSVASAMVHVVRLDIWNARLRLNWARGTVRGFLRAAPLAT